MGAPTEKMQNMILKNNWASLEEVEQMSFEQASALIGSKLSKGEQPKSNPAASSRYPSPASPYKAASAYPKPDNSKTMYLAYAKDLTVCVLNKLITPVDASIVKAVLLDQVANIKAAIKEFDKA